MITKDSILIAQNKFAQGLIEIGKHCNSTEDISNFASKIISNLYEYQEANALFKPTKAMSLPFRSTLEGTLSYFIGANSKYPEDTGFALQPWIDIQFKNHGFVFNADSAIAMGCYEFINSKNNTVKAEYSFSYRKNSQEQLKIVLHHSSLPYSN